ncbi:MAG: acetylxylan esterase [Clostridia bacterium]|nr:acetylxylan esterase [Eubacteriales bacterium]MDD3867658.1 acetylxylan esterase [Eubacteriales bacterium]MDD4461683.1 acetylxylan esterase [Eubacteriales bacterium]NCC49186.1 acetylxylan esterase [Clostridia bacterium]
MLTLEQLRQIHVPLTRQHDYDAFWRRSRDVARQQPVDAQVEPIDYPVSSVRVFDVTYRGFDTTPIHGWLIIPHPLPQPKIPCLIHFHGFSGDRGWPGQYLHWTSLGIAVLAIDCREQGGHTGNHAQYNSGHLTNLACKGILDPYEYYFRAVYMDCVKALDFACHQPQIDPQRLILEGGSQGGALAIAAAGLDARPWLVMADVPSNSDLRQRVEQEHGSFASVADYLRRHPDDLDQVFKTLSYFDTINLADRIRAPLLASVGLKDSVCPAECFFATYNRITARKDIVLYPYNGHEGGGALHTERKLAWLAEWLGRDQSRNRSD